MQAFLEQTIWLNNPLKAWLYALLVAIVSFIVIKLALGWVSARFTGLAQKYPDSRLFRALAGVIKSTRSWVILLLVIIIALRTLHFPAGISTALSWAIVALVGIQVATWVSTIFVAFLQRMGPSSNMKKSNPVIFSLMSWFVQTLIWTTLLLILLSQAGVHIGAFIASLGVGGIAIAMAAQNVLADLLASVAIGLDKPFTEGDFIGFGDESGTVRKVGIKSTRIDALSGEEIIIANAALLQQLCHNYNRMQERRVVFGFQIPTNTKRALAEKIIERCNAIIQQQDQVRFDRGHLLGIEAQGLRFEFVYYVLEPGYALYCDIQQNINLQIMGELETLEVPFAIPARKVYQQEA